MNKEELLKKVELAEKELGNFVENVNREIAFRQGGIACLKAMLAELEEKSEAVPVSEN